MAMIKCPECGNDVSDKASTCPHCGVAIATTPAQAETGPVSLSAPKPSFWTPPNVISIIALSITTLSLVFPFVQVQFLGSKISKSLIEGDGLFFIPLLLIAFLLLIAKKKVGYSIASILIILLSVFEVVWFNNRIEEMGEYKNLCQRGIGFTFLVLGAIMLLVSILMHAEKKK